MMAQGFNTVYGQCPPGSLTINPQASFAMVDATKFGTSTDICAAIATIFTTYNSSTSKGIVIDARGFSSANLTCNNGGISPWSGSVVSPPSVVLLPAGSITLYETLTLPSFTRLVGAGSGLTTLTAVGSGFSGTGDMIDMGSKSACEVPPQQQPYYFRIAIEHLALNANNVPNLSGIANYCSQELSYVDDVALTQFAAGGTGLWLNDHSDNSGPYTNISYSGNGVCAKVFNNSGVAGNHLNQTRGIHGLTCTMTGTTPAIYLDAPNNSLEDIFISHTGSSTPDGILIGSQAPAQNNALFNINGSGLHDVVHISSQTSMSATCPASSNVCDLSILAVTSSGSTNSIEDDLTGTPPTILTNPFVGMYNVGEPMTGAGYSRFTGRAVTWLVGRQPPMTGACAPGRLYSCTNGASCNIASELYTLWRCNSSGAWSPIK
jgi:hypothetical protein